MNNMYEETGTLIERTSDDEYPSISWDNFAEFPTCYYLRKDNSTSNIEIWGPGKRWGTLDGMYTNSFLVIRDLPGFSTPWEILAGPFDTMDEAKKQAILLYLLLGD